MYRKLSVTVYTLLYAFCAFMPILPSYFSIGNISMYYVLAAGFAVLTLAFLKGKLKKVRFKGNVLTLFFLVWILAHSLSMLLTEGIFNVFLFLLITIVVFIFVSSVIYTAEVFIKSIHTLIYTSGVIAVFGVIEAFTHFNIFSYLNTSGATLNYSTERFGRVRLLSYSWQTIVYGVYLMFCMILILYCVQLLKKADRRKVIFMIIYALLWINLLLTLSRSSILAALLANLLFLYFSGFARMLKIILIVAVCAFAGIVVAALLFPSIYDFIKKAYIMLIALVDDSYASEISSSFGTNLKASGNRLDLYNWVVKSMKDKWLFGYGQHAQFEYPYKVTNGMFTWTIVKKGIENSYLDLIYRYGLVGAIPEFVVYIVMLLYSFIQRAKADWEKKVGFNAAFFSLFLAYFLEMFAVNQSSERNMFYLIVMLFLVYNMNGKFKSKEKRLSNA